MNLNELLDELEVFYPHLKETMISEARVFGTVCAGCAHELSLDTKRVDVVHQMIFFHEKCAEDFHERVRQYIEETERNHFDE